VPVYAYKGVTDAGRNTKGFVDADSDRTARAKLRRDGIFLTELAQSGANALPEHKQQPIAQRRISLDSFRRISGTDLAIATRQLATLLGGAVASLDALEVESLSEPLSAVESALDTAVNELDAALATVATLGVPPDEAAAALTGFRGVKRRQELRGEARGVTVLDDFAHHPTAVAGSIAAVRARYPGRRLVALFEPRTNTSRGASGRPDRRAGNPGSSPANATTPAAASWANRSVPSTWIARSARSFIFTAPRFAAAMTLPADPQVSTSALSRSGWRPAHASCSNSVFTDRPAASVPRARGAPR